MTIGWSGAAARNLYMSDPVGFTAVWVIPSRIGHS